jgi:hypothetical protein
MGLQIRHHEVDGQLADAVLTRRHQAKRVAVRIIELGDSAASRYRDVQAADAARGRIGQPFQAVIDLEHRVADGMPELLHASAEGQQLAERYPRLLLPEPEHLLAVAGEQSHVQGGFGELEHGMRSCNGVGSDYSNSP